MFEVTYDPTTHTATWTNIDHNLGDEPITDVALDSNTGDLFVSTDFGVNILKSGSEHVGSGRGQSAASGDLRADDRLERAGPLRRDARPRCLEPATAVVYGQAI